MCNPHKPFLPQSCLGQDSLSQQQKWCSHCPDPSCSYSSSCIPSKPSSNPAPPEDLPHQLMFPWLLTYLGTSLLYPVAAMPETTGLCPSGRRGEYLLPCSPGRIMALLAQRRCAPAFDERWAHSFPPAGCHQLRPWTVGDGEASCAAGDFPVASPRRAGQKYSGDWRSRGTCLKNPKPGCVLREQSVWREKG